MKHVAISLAILLFILSSCTHIERAETQFTPAKISKTNIESFTINEVLKPIDIGLSEHFICLLNEEKGADDQIYIYDADNLDFKYSFAKRGTGPRETLALDIVRSIKGDTLRLFDQVNYKMNLLVELN